MGRVGSFLKPRLVMKSLTLLGIVLLVAASPHLAHSQERRRDEAAFVKERPAVGDALPEITVYDVNGKEVKTSSLRGQYIVLTFGCLT
jgi:cytochrome oxidase Cu insertion factor (SCO1/SenC/PrrC family)